MRIAVGVLALFLLSACQSGTDAAAANGASDAAGPVVEVASATDLIRDLDALDAETVVLNFWATWCGPCRAEFPMFVAYGREHADDGVAVRFVSVDTPRMLDAVKQFLAEHEVTDPSYLYTGTGDVTSQLNPFVGGAVPITMVLDGEGIVQNTHVGAMTQNDLEEMVALSRSNS